MKGRRVTSEKSFSLPVIQAESGTGHNAFEYNHPCHRPAILFLFGHIYAVRLRVDGEAMHRVLHMKVLELSIVISIVCVKYRNETTVAGYINASEACVKFDNVGTVRQG